VTVSGPEGFSSDRANNRVLIPPATTAPERPPSDIVWSLDCLTMGTSWSARVVPAPGTDKQALTAAIQSELDAVVDLFSPWKPDSEISRFNTAPAGVWALSDPFWELLDAAMDIADIANGAVDPTLGALVDLWGFGPPGPRDAEAPTPSDAEIEAALAVSGWHKLRLNREARAAIQSGGQSGGMKLDFSGIAKGHAVDRVSARLSAEGATSHLIEIGGELRGVGVKPDGQPWWVEIEQPPVPAGLAPAAPRTVCALFDLAVATSGDYRRAFVHDGRLFSHTLDGRTGRPIDNGLACVTVFHASAMQADAWATALMVLGVEEGLELAETLELAAHFIARGPTGPVEHMTPAYRAMMDEN
jgi:thiamine biosynthesis lipoprotein